MTVDKELTRKMASELIPRRVLVTQAIVLLDEFVDKASQPDQSGAGYAAQLKGPELIGASQKVIDEIPSIEFLFEVGYRLVHQTTSDKEGNGQMETDDQDVKEDSEDHLDPVALIALNMRLIMLKTTENDYSDDELASFGKTSGAFQVWPYFREFLHSAFVRAGLEPPPVQMFTLRD